MKTKEIEEILNEIKDEDNYIEEYGFRYKRITLEDWWFLLTYIEYLEKNRDKAIEVIDLITPELWNISKKMTYRLKDIKYILKGDSDE